MSEILMDQIDALRIKTGVDFKLTAICGPTAHSVSPYVIRFNWISGMPTIWYCKSLRKGLEWLLKQYQQVAEHG